MKHKLMIPLLLLALVISTAWGYSQFQARRQWEINAENQYQRAFEEFTSHVGNMENAMSKTLVAGSFPLSNRLLTDIWRESNSSQTSMGQLPLTSMELSHIKMLLAKISTFSFNSAQNQLMKGNRFGDKEWNILKNFRDQIQIVQRHLTALREQFYSNRARWLEVDRLGPVGATGLAGSRLNNNKVTKAFLMLEDGLRRVPDVQFEGNNLGFIPKPTGLTGKNISVREAKAITRRFLGPDYRNSSIKYDRIIYGGFPSYMVTVNNRRQRNPAAHLSISVKGGHIAWMLGNRNVRNARFNMNQAEQAAKSFLARNRYPAMETVSRERFANIVTVSLCPVRNQIIFYPELVKVQVAQDTGKIIGMDAVAFLTFSNPNAYNIPKPRFSEADIRRLLNPHLKLSKIRLAQVLDEMYNKVLCYEVSGALDNNRYLIYYNADTGKEEKLRRVDQNGNEIQ